MRFVFLIFIARLVEKRLWTRRHTPLVLDQSGKKMQNSWKFCFGFWIFHSANSPLLLLPLSDTNQNSAAFRSYESVGADKEAGGLWGISEVIFWNGEKGSVILIKCINVEKRLLRRRASIRFHVLLCCLIVSNKWQLGRAGLHHFVRK